MPRLSEAQSQRHAALQMALALAEESSTIHTPEQVITLAEWILAGRPADAVPRPVEIGADWAVDAPTILQRIDSLRGA